MDVSLINGTPTSAAERSRTNLADDFDNFLLLLTTQLSHQDPLDPVDSNEFVAQLVSFTGVEQAVKTNSNLEKLLSLFGANQTTAAVGYLGTTVEAEGDTTRLAGGTARFHYSMAESAIETSIVITNDRGETVFVGKGDASAGDHTFVWDGRDDGGAVQPDGQYKISISAKKADDTRVPVTTTVAGRVSRVEVDDGKIFLTVNGIRVPIENIVSVTESDPPTQATPG